MLKKSSWRLEPLKGLIFTSKDHVLLPHIVHEEDLLLRLDLLSKVEVEEMQVPCNEGDAEMEDDAEADGSVVVKEERRTLHRPELAHSALAVVSTDTTLGSVLKEPVDPCEGLLLRHQLKPNT